mmetsp:Transcript_1987/g.2959  ORF Transcript_1987/g.2959 Transcript_1987/m.2959 type:complete len:400 (+) Transcript_1987:154-1353(+)
MVDQDKDVGIPPPTPPPTRSSSTMSSLCRNDSGAQCGAGSPHAGPGPRVPFNTPNATVVNNCRGIDELNPIRRAVLRDHDSNDGLVVAVQEKLKKLVVESGASEEEEMDRLADLHEEYLLLQEEYFIERKMLEQKYTEKYAHVFRRRREFVEEENQKKTDIDFWLTAFRQNPIVAEFIQKDDEDALSYLMDVRCIDVDQAEEQANCSKFGFKLEFYFLENPYFHNKILTKTYRVPNLYGNCYPILESTKGCSIEWRSERVNLQIGPADGDENDDDIGGVFASQLSFFNFFDSPWMEITQTQSPNDLDEDVYAELHEQVAMDFRIGYEFYQHIVPEAYRWFTGEAALEEANIQDDDEDDEDDAEEDNEYIEDEAQNVFMASPPKPPPSSAAKSEEQCQQQ